MSERINSFTHKHLFHHSDKLTLENTILICPKQFINMLAYILLFELSLF